MNVGDLGSLASAIAAFAALIVSIVSIRKTNKFGETTDRLNRLLIEREKAEGIISKRADLSANIINLGRNNYRLKIFNRGKGVAHHVKLIDMNSDNTVLISNDIKRKFPVPILEQHQSVELAVAVSHGSTPHIHIKLIWDDETGKNHEKELTPVI
jgi:hypothetical protein